MAGPKVSIIVPVYNGANYMRDAIDSALAQTWGDTEVVVVNDGSRDDGATEAIALSYGDRIRYVAKPNGGVASALNAGIAAMTGEVFCWCSHDDMHLPEKAARQVAEWDRLGRPDCVLYSDYRVIDLGGEKIADLRLDHAMLDAKPEYALLRGSVHGCSVFVPRRLFERFGGFDETLPTTQDYDLWFRMVQDVPFIHMPDVLVLSRWHDEQGSKKIDHRIEAAGLWRKMMDGIPRGRQIALEDSVHRFYIETARFLRANALDLAAEHAEARAAEGLENALVSVVVPVHTRIDMALSAVDSALAQNNASVEVIVVDDGCLPAASARLASAIASRERTRLIRQPRLGRAAACNAGWAEACGDYIAFLDPADLFLPGKISMQFRAMVESGAAVSRTCCWQRDGAGINRQFEATGQRVAEDAFADLPAHRLAVLSAIMVRQDLREAGFGFPEQAAVADAAIFWLRASARFGSLCLGQALVLARNPAAAVTDSLRVQAQYLAGIEAAVAADDHLLRTAGPHWPRLRALAAAAQTAEKAAAASRMAVTAVMRRVDA